MDASFIFTPGLFFVRVPFAVAVRSREPKVYLQEQPTCIPSKTEIINTPASLPSKRERPRDIFIHIYIYIYIYTFIHLYRSPSLKPLVLWCGNLKTLHNPLLVLSKGNSVPPLYLASRFRV